MKLFVLFLLAVAIVVAIVLPARGAHRFDIGFRVTTRHPTNVVAGYKLTCSNGTRTVHSAERFEADTPFTSSVNQNMVNPTSCHIRVVAWDVPPWVNPHHGQRPVVTSWVT